MNYVRKLRGREGEDESVQTCMGREEELFACAYTLHTHLFLRNSDTLTQLKFIATIHEVKNVSSSQSSTVTACNGFISSLWYMNQKFSLNIRSSFWCVCDTFLISVIWVKSSVNRPHFFNINIKDRAVLIFSLSKMNHFVCACVEREVGYVPTYTVPY